MIWSPYYEIYSRSLESVQRKFLNFLYFKKHKVYPLWTQRSRSLRTEFGIQSLHIRRVVASVLFLRGKRNRITLHSSVADRTSDRVGTAFWCPRARTNLGLNSPIYVMTSRFNSLSRDPNLLLGPAQAIVSTVLRCFGSDFR